MPLVEIVGGVKTSEQTIQRATEFYAGLGKRPVRLHKELPGHVANRLQAALSREVYYLVSEGVVSAADADTACSWGPGLRWGIMGSYFSTTSAAARAASSTSSNSSLVL